MAREVVQDVVSEIFDAFVGAGYADEGTYTEPGGSPVSVRVFIRRGGQTIGNFGHALANKASLQLLLAEVPAPIAGAVIAADNETFTLVEQLDEDEAIATWSVE